MTETLKSTDAPPPGVYPATPMETYHRWSAASNSRLTELRRSPAHLKAYLEQPREDTTATLIGRAVHTAVLEPMDFAERFTVAQICNAIKKDGAQCSNPGTVLSRELGWLCGVHQKGMTGAVDTSRVVLPETDYQTCVAVAASIHRHPSAKALLVAHRAHVELSAVWTDEDTGVLCKGRFDCHSPGIAGGAIVDIKTTRDASPLAFERSIFTLGYHRQAAMYSDGAKALGLPAQHFVIVAVEKEAPYAVAVYRLTDDAIEAGRQEVRALLARYGQCVEADVWPAYGDGIVDISLPAWSWQQSAAVADMVAA